MLHRLTPTLAAIRSQTQQMGSRRTYSHRSSSHDHTAGGEDALIGFSRTVSSKDTASLHGSVEKFSRHVFVCDAPGSTARWPARVEDYSADYPRSVLLGSLIDGIQGMVRDSKITVCDAGAHGDGVDILDFAPGRPPVRISNITNVDQLQRYFAEGDRSGLAIKEYYNEKFVFVCGHGSRDARCGYCGPRLMKEFVEYVALHGKEKQFFFALTSHVGGHKYAANVLVYPQGAWYGFVTPKDVPTLLDAAESKTTVDSLLRGIAWK